MLLRRYNNLLSKEYNFNTLLVVVVLYFFVILPFQADQRVEDILFLVFYLLLLTSTMPFLVRHRRFDVMALLMVMPVIFLILGFLYDSFWIKSGIDLFIIFYVCVLVWALVRRTFSRGSMDRNRVQGAILIYLMIAFAFALVYHMICLISGPAAIQGLLVYNRREFLYFSYSTLTTVGYGNVVPKVEFARSLANLEALFGQLYPAVLIARIVSMESVNAGSSR